MTIPAVSAIADVLALWDDDGWLTPPLRPVVGAPEPIIGRALTVSINAAPQGEGFGAMYDVLSNDLSGRVVVVAGAEGLPGAMFGEILCTAAKQQGVAGVLVHGWVRDRPDLERLGVPVYASGEQVAGPNGWAQVRGVEIDVRVADTAVASTDHIVADITGVVRVRDGHLDEVLDAARRYAAGEALVAEALAAGEPLSSAYRHKKAVVDELRRR
ncbi:MAG: RraA family protein [Ilumatobacteraceae bacterium]